MDKPQLYFKEIPGKGRAVFSATPIEKDDLIEECPMIVLSSDDFEHIRHTLLMNYCFFVNKDENTIGIALGFGSLYNHAFPCNAHHIIDKDSETITFFALRDIHADEEICINYNGEPDNESTAWFDKRQIIYQH